VVTEFSVVHVNWVQLNFTIDMSSLSIILDKLCIFGKGSRIYAFVG